MSFGMLRVVSASDCGVRGLQVRITLQTVVFITIAAAICSLGHGLRTFTAVPRSTQPSALVGRENEYQLTG